MAILYARGKDMKWNLKKIEFLHPPDNFIGSFTNEKMQIKHKTLQEKKINTILKNIAASEDPLTAMRTLNNLDHIQFLRNNIEEFKKYTCLEETVLKLYRKTNSAFSSGETHNIWHDLFLECDAERFYRLGAPFPDGKIQIFRGSITGVEKGFLERWRDKERGGGTVFSTMISRKDILIYFKDEQEKELIVSPQFLKTADIETV